MISRFSCALAIACLLSAALAQTASAQNFSIVSGSPVVVDGGLSGGMSWADADGDGHLDLLVHNGRNGTAVQANFFYRNQGDGTFLRDAGTNAPGGLGVNTGCTWGDYDNDGDPDLYTGSCCGFNNVLYRNEGKGEFAYMASFSITSYDGGNTRTVNWTDYDNDGDIDLFVCNVGRVNSLFINDGAGDFIKELNSTIVKEASVSVGSAWADYDNDGDQDLYVANGGGSGQAPNFLYRNFLRETGRPDFAKLGAGPPVTDASPSVCGSWADYDNDGDFDLFVTNFQGANNDLYENIGEGNFRKVTSGIIVNDGGNSLGSAWADYDNDADLDLYVTNSGTQVDFLYENQGDGTFMRVTTGSIATLAVNSIGAAWGDYDRDGDLDLAVGVDGNAPNLLYRNDLANGNHWINILLEGTRSNRSAIGAKVRVKARIGGRDVWQLRQVAGQTGWLSQNSLNVEFGLDDAASIDSLVVEWPSGQVEVFTDVPTNQFMTITEFNIPSSVNESVNNNAGPAAQFGSSAYPNPAYDYADIRYRLESPGAVHLDVYAASGLKVARLDAGVQAAGMQGIRWNSRDTAGNRVSTGVYLYTIRVNDVLVQTGRVLLIQK